MTMKVSIKDDYIDKFEEFKNSLPKDAIEVDAIDDNGISFEYAQKKVQKAINNISQNKGVDLDSAFDKVSNYWSNTT